jgi:hypothetical protein
MSVSSVDAEAVFGAFPYSSRTCRAAVGGPFALARTSCSAVVLLRSVIQGAFNA